jgi:hypothetical protein
LVNPNIIQYIQQNRGVYTREAIDRQLVANGYDPAEVAEAWRMLGAEEEAAPGPQGVPAVGPSEGDRGAGDYIRLHRDTYPRDAIDAQLQAAGYSPADIEAGWRNVSSVVPPPSRWGDDAAHQAPVRRRFASSPVFWLTMIGFILLSYGVPALFGWLFSLNAETMPSAGLVSSVSFVLLQLGGIVGGILLQHRNRSVGMGFLIGVLMVVVVLPTLAFCIFFGICLVGLGGFGTLGF